MGDSHYPNDNALSPDPAVRRWNRAGWVLRASRLVCLAMSWMLPTNPLICTDWPPCLARLSQFLRGQIELAEDSGW